MRLVEATRIDAQMYEPQTTLDEDLVIQPYAASIPVEMMFLDLPLLTGDEVPTAPHVAAASDPWSGNVALYAAAQDSDYTLQKLLSQRATIGLTTSELFAGPIGIWDRQAGFTVELIAGELSATTKEALLAGGNTFAIGDGSAGGWEIMQFQDAVPVAAGRYALAGLLRGQAGTRTMIPAVWPEGSRVVLLDGVPGQIDLPAAARGTTRHFRYGPADSPMSASSYQYETHVFQGNGLRPYPVAHLRTTFQGADLQVRWIRCTRIDGDVWADDDVPLGEETEVYVLRVVQDDIVLRQELLSSPSWTYQAVDILAETSGELFQIEVAQRSARYGAGPFRSVSISKD